MNVDEALAIIQARASAAHPDGFYRLTADVENPSPDRRQKHDWRALPLWQKGKRFTIYEGRVWTGPWSHNAIALTTKSDAYQAKLARVLPALRPETPADNPDTELEWALYAHGGFSITMGADILCILVRRGKVTIPEAIDALGEVLRRLEEDDERVRAALPPDEEPPP